MVRKKQEKVQEELLEEKPKPKRKRRTKAEIEAEKLAEELEAKNEVKVQEDEVVEEAPKRKRRTKAEIEAEKAKEETSTKTKPKSEELENVAKVIDNIVTLSFSEAMGERFGRYSKYIIQDRALPDARDGLKPVQRRILYGLHTEGNRYDKPYRKSAKGVGIIMGNYHPHGDSSIYEAMVRMSQYWKMRHCFIDMHGNNGSMDGDGAAAMRYCLVGDALVLTDKGLVKIEDIVENSQLNSDSDIFIKVESINGLKNKATKFFNSGSHKTVKVELQNGFNIEGTENHPVLVLTKDTEGKPAFAWVLLEDISLGDKVVLSRSTSQISSDINLVNKEVAGLLGLLVSEGFISGENQKYYRVGLNNKDLNLVDFAYNAFENNFKEKYKKITRRENGSTEVISIDSKELYFELVEKYDLKLNSSVKVIPEVVLKSSKEIQKEFLRYLFEGDGSVTYNEKGSSVISYTSYSKELINQLQILLLSFGVVSAKHIDGNGERLIINGYNNIKAFNDNIGFVSKRKTSVLESLLDYYKEDTGMSTKDYVPFISDYIRNKYAGTKEGRRLNRINFDRKNKFENRKEELKTLLNEEDFNYLNEWISKDYIYLDVVNIEDSNEEKVVYSIKVDSECHSFVANGIVNHNTESRLSEIAGELLKEIDKNTVDMTWNFDDTEKEPTVLPASFPNLLVNGAKGISAGYATDIPTHNLVEIINAAILLLEKPNSTLDDVMKIVKGPDFPTGAIIQGIDGIRQAYETGRGKIVVRSRYEIEDLKGGKQQIVLTEIPYDVVKQNLVKKIDEIRADKKIDGILEVRDETSKEGVRIAIELKKDAPVDLIINYLLKNTDMQINYNFNMVAIVDRTPKTLGIVELLDSFVVHRKEVVKRRLEFELEKAKKRLHIVEGLIKALSILDKVVATIKSSKNKSDAKVNIEKAYGFSPEQSEAIVSLQLYRLSNTDIKELEKEGKELEKEIKTKEAILASELKLKNLIVKELEEIRDKYGDERKTEIQANIKEIVIDTTQLIAEEEVFLSVSRDGYIKRSSLRSVNSSGGKDVCGIKEGDELVLLGEGKTTQHLLVFTDKGNYAYLPVHTLNDDKWKDVGTHLSSYVNAGGGENVLLALLLDNLNEEKYISIIKENGLIKRTLLKEYEVTRTNKLYSAINMKDGDKVVYVGLTDSSNTVLIYSKNGYGLKFSEEEVNPKGVKTDGMRAIDLREGDLVEKAFIVSEKESTVVEKSHGELAEYPRGRKGNKVKPVKKK